MAIYDNNGTTSYEIGKLYDNNGTTSSQIGKVYDNNGTTNSLIYQSQVFVIDTSQSVTPNTWGVKAFNDNYSEVSCSYSATGGVRLNVHNNYGGATEQVQRDFAQFSKITIYVSALDIPNTWNKRTRFGINTSSSSDPLGGPGLSKYVDITSTGTYTLDISSYTGKGYLAIHHQCYGYVTISKIILE